MLYFVVFLLILLASGLSLTASALVLSCDAAPTLPAAVDSGAWLQVAAANTSYCGLSGFQSTLWVQEQIRHDNATARALERAQYREAALAHSFTGLRNVHDGRWTTVDDVYGPQPITCVRPRVPRKYHAGRRRSRIRLRAAKAAAVASSAAEFPSHLNFVIKNQLYVRSREELCAPPPKIEGTFLCTRKGRGRSRGHARRIKAAAKELKGRLKEIKEARVAAEKAHKDRSLDAGVDGKINARNRRVMRAEANAVAMGAANASDWVTPTPTPKKFDRAHGTPATTSKDAATTRSGIETTAGCAVAATTSSAPTCANAFARTSSGHFFTVYASDASAPNDIIGKLARCAWEAPRYSSSASSVPTVWAPTLPLEPEKPLGDVGELAHCMCSLATSGVSAAPSPKPPSSITDIWASSTASTCPLEAVAAADDAGDAPPAATPDPATTLCTKSKLPVSERGAAAPTLSTTGRGGSYTPRDAREAPGDDPTRHGHDVLRVDASQKHALAAPLTSSTHDTRTTATSPAVVAGSARRHRPFGRMLGGASAKGVALKNLASTDEERVWAIVDESINHGDAQNEHTWRNDVVDALGERAYCGTLERLGWDFALADVDEEFAQPVEFKIVHHKDNIVVDAIAERCSVSRYGRLELHTKDLNNMLGAEYLLEQSVWLEEAESEGWIGDGKEVDQARVEIEQADGMPLVFLDPRDKRLAYVSTKALGRLVGSEDFIRNGFRKVRVDKGLHVHFTASTTGDHVFNCKHPGFVDGDEEGEEKDRTTGTPFYDIKISVKPGGQLRKIVCSGTFIEDESVSFKSVEAFEKHREVKAANLSLDGIGEKLNYVNLNISTQSPLYLGMLSDSSDRLSSALDAALALDNFRDADNELSLKFPVEVLTGYDVNLMRDRFDISYEDFQRKHQHDEWTPDERELFEGFLHAPVSKRLRVDGVEVDPTIQRMNFDLHTGVLEECRGRRLATTVAPRRRF